VSVPAVLISGIRRSIPRAEPVTIVAVSRHYEGVVVGPATQVEENPFDRQTLILYRRREDTTKAASGTSLHRDHGTAVALNSGYLSLERVKMLLSCCARAKFRVRRGSL